MGVVEVYLADGIWHSSFPGETQDVYFSFLEWSSGNKDAGVVKVVASFMAHVPYLNPGGRD